MIDLITTFLARVGVILMMIAVFMFFSVLFFSVFEFDNYAADAVRTACKAGVLGFLLFCFALMVEIVVDFFDDLF